MTQPVIELTNSAIEHIRKTIQQQKSALGFRLTVKKTGCSGYSYVPAIIEQISANDIHFVMNGDLHIYIDPVCVDIIKGTKLDYVRKGMLSQLVFDNPNVEGICGCGESFQIKEVK